MAFTDRYVSSTGTDTYANSTSSGTPMSMATALANASAGDRINVISDGTYNLGTTSQTNAGNATDLIIWRGYNTTIGDLDSVGRDTPANGSGLITTDMPVISMTGSLTLASYTAWMNFNVSGSVGGLPLFGATTAPDNLVFYQCRFVNSNSSANTQALRVDDHSIVVMCDLDCTGATHGDVLDMGLNSLAYANKITGTSTSVALLILANGAVVGNVFFNGGTAIEVGAGGTLPTHVLNNTAYNCAKFFEMPNSAHTVLHSLTNNHVTDCTEFIDNLYSATAENIVVEIFNRTRDNTTARTGIGDGLLVGEITTDTGGAETDYTNAASEDFSLITGAPGRNAALGFPE